MHTSLTSFALAMDLQANLWPVCLFSAPYTTPNAPFPNTWAHCQRVSHAKRPGSIKARSGLILAQHQLHVSWLACSSERHVLSFLYSNHHEVSHSLHLLHIYTFESFLACQLCMDATSLPIRLPCLDWWPYVVPSDKITCHVHNSMHAPIYSNIEMST